MEIKTFVYNPVQENTYLIFDESKQCVIVDAGCYNNSEFSTLNEFIKENELEPQFLLNTHGHFDHILGINQCRKIFNLQWKAHKGDLSLINTAPQQAMMFGMSVDVIEDPDEFLNDGDIVQFGNSELKLIHVPGHSPGSLCLYNEKDGQLITGDVLFRGSIGRSDLPGGDHNLLVAGIKSKLLSLPDNVVIYPGHGPQSTIADERSINPYLI